MIDVSTFDCTGCSACANICGDDAIFMEANEEGFYIPIVDNEKCVRCGLCVNVCPEINDIKKNTKTPDCYAVMADDELRFKSSSGGAFGVIADKILEKNGLVCGAAFDENWIVKHIIVDNKNDLEKLRGSKYVQSFVTENLYKELRMFLENGRHVLFAGTPCQVAGLKNFLAKDYENLLLVDLICSKVPSQKQFDKYLKDYGINKRDIKGIKFRNKENGWNCSTINTYTYTYTSRYWFKAYLNDLIMNNSCVKCQYMSIDRVGDLTIGDFWGISKFRLDLDDNKGTSVVLANTKKEKIFSKVWIGNEKKK